MKQVTINNKILSLEVLNYGAVIQKLMVPDKNGELFDVVVGMEKPEDYLKDTISLGASIGRFAGRISGGGFELEGERYDLYCEDGVHLHGGREGFGRKYWEIIEVVKGESPRVVLGYISAHLEEGYPGELQVKVTYELHENALHITHEAETNKPTIVNLTNHSYFRLDDQPNIDKYRLTLNSSHILETDHKLLPSGNLLDIRDTASDFRKSKPIGSLRLDTPFVLGENSDYLGEVYSEHSGIRMKVTTNQPAAVIYTPPNFPAICFETQNFPDAPNHLQFPSSILQPGERYLNTAVFEFDLVN